jgi:hypothetical protein
MILSIIAIIAIISVIGICSKDIEMYDNDESLNQMYVIHLAFLNSQMQ